MITRYDMRTILPVADFKLSSRLKELGFKEPVSERYREGILVDDGSSSCQDYNGMKLDEIVSAPTLQEVQAWLSVRKRMDVLVYREVFFDQLGGYYAVVIRRKDSMIRETKKAISYNLALEAGIKTAVTILCKKRKRK